jgi:hypothetical protein
MSLNKFKLFRRPAVFLVTVLFMLSFVSFASGGQDVDLEKKYADILGSWEVDLTDAGMGMLIVEFFAKDGRLWAQRELANPDPMIPVAGEEWKFTVDSEWELEFIKDDNGKYHKCKVINEMAGIDTIGVKSSDLEKQEVDLEKKYADILGNWELDLTDAGMGMLAVELYVKDDALWILPEMDDPAKMILVLGEEWKFMVKDEGSVWEIEFMKDEHDKYHKCIVINESAGINTTGEKK